VHKHRVHSVSLALAAVLWAALLPEAAAQSPQRVGIVVTTAVNLDESEADELAAALGQALEQSLGVVVTAGAETRRRLPRDGVPAGCVGDAACRTDLGQRLDADELLMTVAARVGNRVQLDITWVEVASGKVASRPVIVLEGDADRTAVLRGSGKILLPHIQPVPRSVDVRAAESAPALTSSDQPERSERHMTTGTWIAGSVSAVTLAGALGAGVFSKSLYDDSCGEGCDRSGISLELSNTIGDALAIVSVAAGVTALVLYLGSDEPAAAGERADASRPGRPVVGLGAGPDRIQIRIGGAF
jgi:hypothetical protein